MTTPAQPRDPPRRMAQVPGGPFSYTDEGVGPVLVAVHGLPGSVRDFRWLGAALPDTVRFVRVDLPGFGGTPLSTAPQPGIDARGAFLVDVLRALDISHCVVIGHSMGGAVALSAAVQAPDRIVALGLVASIGLRPHHVLRRFLGPRLLARAVDVPILARPTRLLFRAMLRLLAFPPQLPDDAVAHTLRCVGALDFQAQVRNTAKLAVPTLAAWALDDALIETAVSEEHATALPPGRRLVFATGGHNVQKSQAVEVAAALAALAKATADYATPAELSSALALRVAAPAKT